MRRGALTLVPVGGRDTIIEKGKMKDGKGEERKTVVGEH